MRLQCCLLLLSAVILAYNWTLAPFWLLFLLFLYCALEPKPATILAIVIPMLAGIGMIELGMIFSPLRTIGTYLHGWVKFSHAGHSVQRDRYLF
jgi:hypothetical protein